jgi:hypothetical protein
MLLGLLVPARREMPVPVMKMVPPSKTESEPSNLAIVTFVGVGSVTYCFS